MINEKLREYRKANRLTQQQIADVLNIERSTYTYYENGRHRPSVIILKKLSMIYDVPIDCLVENNIFNNQELEDGTNLYNRDMDNESNQKKYLSEISKEEQELIMLYRMINDKGAVFEALKGLNGKEEGTP